MNALISIRPNFCHLIFDGKKIYEYRKKVFTRSDVDKVYIYATKPICKIIGCFAIDNIITDTPSKVWLMTHEHGGITRKQFNDYFNGCNVAHAIKIKNLERYDIPIDPKTVIKDFTAPQNFIYVD
jgi:predicted transcriptional regulator